MMWNNIFKLWSYSDPPLTKVKTELNRYNYENRESFCIDVGDLTVKECNVLYKLLREDRLKITIKEKHEEPMVEKR